MPQEGWSCNAKGGIPYYVYMDTTAPDRSSPTLVAQILLFAAIGAAGLAISACSAAKSGSGTEWLDVSMDGKVAEWPADASVAMDDQFAYFRLSVQNEQFTLQAAPQTVAVLIDCDADPATGKYLYLGKDEQGRAKKLGADLEIQFSPMNAADPAKPKKGVALFSLAKDGSRKAIERGTLDVVFLPTYASPWYELRVSRHMKGRAELPQRGLFSSGATTGVFVLYGDTRETAGQIVGYADPFGIASPPAPAAAPEWRPTVMDLPKKDARELRVVSYNVIKSKPLSSPDTFKRIFDALEPDFILLQEWEADDTVTQGWFNALVSSPTGWFVQASPAADCAIISRHALTSFGSEAAEGVPNPMPLREGQTARPWTPRFIGAFAHTPLGTVVLGSGHLKCCGSKDSPEDQLRIAETESINRYLHGGLVTSPAKMRIIGGDFNLVGSRTPLDVLVKQLDSGQDLAVAEPVVLGTPIKYTWYDNTTDFTPGRLDYVTYSASSLDVSRAFVLDTTILAEESLYRIGLSPNDTLGSDHLPVVVDFRVK